EQPSRRILRTNAAQCPGPRFRRASDGPRKCRQRPHSIKTDREAFCLLEQEDGAQKTHRAAATAAA
ncbi:50S ribosomal protein L32, partial [Dysosmobacter welbionis]